MIDKIPVVDEFGAGSTHCRGDYTGCAVCTCASILLRYGKKIPRLSNGTPDMATLGSSMGRRHRLATPGIRHGLSLLGVCSPPNHGTNWCTFCIFLELKARGVPVGHGKLTHDQIIAHLKLGHSLAVPGLYSKVPVVAVNSYTSTIPARGRSDAGFGGTHMVHAAKLIMSGSTVSRVALADSDFGSASRPVVPPHSEWTWGIFRSYLDALGWSICYTTRAPSALPPVPPPTGLKTVHIKHGAEVRIYTKLHDKPTGPSCIDNDTGTWKTVIWTAANSNAPCDPVVTRKTCDGKSSATTTRIRGGAFEGQQIRVGEPYGVTVTNRRS